MGLHPAAANGPTLGNPKLAEEDRELLDYGDGYVEYYEPQVADPVKWAIDSRPQRSACQLVLWARLGWAMERPTGRPFGANLPYLLPGAQMLYRFDLGTPIDLYPVQGIPICRRCGPSRAMTKPFPFGPAGVRC